MARNKTGSSLQRQNLPAYGRSTRKDGGEQCYSFNYPSYGVVNEKHFLRGAMGFADCERSVALLQLRQRMSSNDQYRETKWVRNLFGEVLDVRRRSIVSVRLK